jgi:hypothetical protein
VIHDQEKALFSQASKVTWLLVVLGFSRSLSSFLLPWTTSKLGIPLILVLLSVARCEMVHIFLFKLMRVALEIRSDRAT